MSIDLAPDVPERRDEAVRSFRPGATERSNMLRVVVPLGGLSAVLAIASLVARRGAMNDLLPALGFGAFGVMIILLACQILSAKVTIGPADITYRSILSRRILPLREIETVHLARVKFNFFLTVRTVETSVVFSDNAFPLDDLREMRDLISARCASLSPGFGKDHAMSDGQLMKGVAIWFLLLVPAAFVLIVGYAVYNARHDINGTRRTGGVAVIRPRGDS